MVKEKGAWVGVHSALANKMVESALRLGLIEECQGFTDLRREVSLTLSGHENSKIDFQLTWNDSESNAAVEAAGSAIVSETTETDESSIKRKKKPLKGRTSMKSVSVMNPVGSVRTMLVEVKSVTLALPVSNNAAKSHPTSTSTTATTMYQSVESDYPPLQTQPQSIGVDKEDNVIHWSAQFPDCPSERAQKHLKYLTDYVVSGKGRAAVLFLIQRDDCESFSACHLDPKYGPLLHKAYLAGVEVLPYHCRLDPVSGTVTLLGRLSFIDKEVDVEVEDSLQSSSSSTSTTAGTMTKTKKVKDPQSVASIARKPRTAVKNKDVPSGDEKKSKKAKNSKQEIADIKS
jgi:DNA-binding sugar fermentation-stimulating protein